MKNQSVGLSPQGEKIYRTLLQTESLNANQLGKALNIFPHAIYRAINPLIKLGLVKKLETYPTSYKAIPQNDGIDNYILYIRNNFLRSFPAKDISQTTTGLSVSFIQNRKELLEISNGDIANAKEEANHIVSGLEVPADTILTLKNACERGVKIRFLVQQLNEVNRDMLKNWEKLGIKVKYFPLLEARIIIIDKQIVYITSYNSSQKEEAIGVRFSYAPIASLVENLFNQRWKIGKEI